MTSLQYDALPGNIKCTLDLYHLSGWILLLWWLLLGVRRLFQGKEESLTCCSESEYIKQNQGTIVYDYQVLTLMYILFQLIHCYGRICYHSFTISEEENLLRKVMVILHDQLSSFKEGRVVPVQREFFSKNMEESIIQSQRESTSDLKDVLMRLQFQNFSDDAFSLSQSDGDLEAVAWRTIAVRLKGHIYSDAQGTQRWLYILCTWLI